MGGRLALVFSVILKQRLHRLVSHRLAALVLLGFNFYFPGATPVGFSIEVTKQNQHRAETGGRFGR